MRVRIAGTIIATSFAMVGFAHPGWLTHPAHAQANRAAAAWNERTPWGDLDLQGEWTSEGEYGVPLERPAQFGTRQFLSDQVRPG